MHRICTSGLWFFLCLFPFCLRITNLSIHSVSPLNLTGVSASALLLSQSFVPNIMIFVLPFAPFFNQGPYSYSLFHCLCHLTPKSFRMMHSTIRCFSLCSHLPGQALFNLDGSLVKHSRRHLCLSSGFFYFVVFALFFFRSPEDL